MAVDCTDDVALRTSICNINTDLEQMIINADGVLTTNYGAKPIKQLVREGINNDLQALGIDYVWATATERAAQTGMVLDEQGYQIDTKEVYKYNGTSWIFYYSLGATEFSDNTFKIVDGARSATTGASFQFSADSIATGNNITITVPNMDLIIGDARRDLSIAHDITTDADYTLTATQNQYGRIEITDTGVVLTGAINIIMNNDEHTFSFINSTAQTLTVKTSAGTGIAVLAGEAKELRNDTVDVIDFEAGFNIASSIASSAEIRTGTNNTKIVTPLGYNETTLGWGQTYQNMTASRSSGVTYTNTSGKAIFVYYGGNGSSNPSLVVDGITIQPSYSYLTTFSFMVPNGSTYKITGIINNWYELR